MHMCRSHYDEHVTLLLLNIDWAFSFNEIKNLLVAIFSHQDVRIDQVSTSLYPDSAPS